MKKCLNCGALKLNGEMSRSTGATAGWCQFCADRHREANPPGFACIKCRERHPLYRMSHAKGLVNWCQACADQLPKNSRARVKERKAPLPPYELVAFRARYGMTQAGFAKAVGVSVPAVSSWERGLTDVPPVVQLAMSAFIAGLPPYNG